MSATGRRLRTVPNQVQLSIGGMTCASCATRIEKRLNRLDGVSASVNYATETATVSYPDALAVSDLIGTVEATGYSATPPAEDTGPATEETATERDERSLCQRLVVSALLSVPVLVLAMVPALQFRNWQWLALTLASPVVVWGAWPFHRAALVNARHGAATMDTLISLGVTVSYLSLIHI